CILFSGQPRATRFAAVNSRSLQGPDAPYSRRGIPWRTDHGLRGEDLMLRRLAVVVALSALLFSSGCCCHRWCCRPCWRPFCGRCCESPCCTPCCTPCAPPVCGPCGP